MDADTKKREAGCTCHQEEGDSECVIHDPPTCKRCGCEYTMEWPNTEPTTYCDACAHVVVDAAEARAERAEATVAYLRALDEWRRRAIGAEKALCLGERITSRRDEYMDWLAANPEPEPPEGVAP